jgi:hypothetical protein
MEVRVALAHVPMRLLVLTLVAPPRDRQVVLSPGSQRGARDAGGIPARRPILVLCCYAIAVPSRPRNGMACR